MKAKRLILIISIVGILMLSIFSFFFSTNTAEYIAHRGHGYFENTAESFANSTKYSAIECDVRISKDGKFIINHDEKVKFSDNTELLVNHSTLKDLTQYKLQNNYKICTLEEYLKICKQLNKTAVIELKVEFTDDEINRLLSEINNHYSKSNCIIISFEKSNLLKLKDKTDIPLQLLFYNNIEENVNFCIANKIHASMDCKIIFRNVVNKLHNNGLKVGAWTVNSPFDNFRMKNLGVDYITSDTLY